MQKHVYAVLMEELREGDEETPRLDGARADDHVRSTRGVLVEPGSGELRCGFYGFAEEAHSSRHVDEGIDDTEAHHEAGEVTLGKDVPVANGADRTADEVKALETARAGVAVSRARVVHPELGNRRCW